MRQRLSDFANIIVAHPHLVSALQELCILLSKPVAPLVVGVVGATGTGKSTLLRLLEQHIIQQELSSIQENPGYIPVTNITAMAPEVDSFQWQAFYYDALVALREPMINDKICPQELHHRTSWPGSSTPRSLALHWSLEQSLRYRGTKALLIDDSQHMCRVSEKATLHQYTNQLVALAQASNTTIVLFGDQEIHELFYLNEQCDQALPLVYVQAYHWDDSQDRQDFAHLIDTLCMCSPLPVHPTLSTEYIFQNSCGCAGILKDWFLDALAFAIDQAATKLTYRHLEATKLASAKLLRIAREIEDHRNVDGIVTRGPNVSTNQVFPPSNSRDHIQIESPLRVGERKPTRDKVGGIKHE